MCKASMWRELPDLFGNCITHKENMIAVRRRTLILLSLLIQWFSEFIFPQTISVDYNEPNLWTTQTDNARENGITGMEWHCDKLRTKRELNQD